LKSIFITGFNGFVGSNLINYFNNTYTFTKYRKNTDIIINNENVIHLAGKAHDLKNVNNFSEYYTINTDLTKVLFDKFLESNANVFIILSSVKAVADILDIVLTENFLPKPETHYGKSKQLAEQYILSKQIPFGKRVYILRPCMIHGPGNKGNLNLLYEMVYKGFPWPLGSFDNKRSFCNIDNLLFIINELIQNDKIPSGIYNIADDEPISTNELISLIAKSLGKKPFILNTPKFLVKFISQLGDVFQLPINTDTLSKLTDTYIVSNKKIKNAINKPLPISTRDGLFKTFKSFRNGNTF
jgi:nucleoside-diphosphate-sugar epimerase